MIVLVIPIHRLFIVNHNQIMISRVVCCFPCMNGDGYTDVKRYGGDFVRIWMCFCFFLYLDVHSFGFGYVGWVSWLTTWNPLWCPSKKWCASWVEYVEDTTANMWYICGYVWTNILFKSPKRVSTRKDNPQKLNHVVKPTIHHPVVIIMFNHVYVFVFLMG